MVFSSIPLYLDPPNWHQHQNQHQANGSDNSTHLLPPLLPQPQPQPQPSHRAQPAKIPIPAPAPETALKCPRCESTNTKFCYYNNYSLSQPRHFCKTCRRYWTRGGALRNVPVGGGCRRNNKKSKRNNSKSPAASNDQKHSLSNSTISAIPSGEIIGRFPQPSNRSFMNLNHYGGVQNMSLSLREIQAQNNHHMGFGHTSTAGGGEVDQWRFQQFPFFNNFEPTSAVSFPFNNQSESVEATTAGNLVGDIATTSRVTNLPQLKFEYNGGQNNHYYSWTDLSGLASSSTSHLL